MRLKLFLIKKLLPLALATAAFFMVIIIGVTSGVVQAVAGGNKNSASATEMVAVPGCQPLPDATAKMASDQLFLKYVKENHLEKYMNLLLALVANESGAQNEPESYNDPMQASESLGLPCNAGKLGKITREQSFKQGCKEFASQLKSAKVSSPTDWNHIYLMLQAYNFGGAFINYVDSHGGKWTQNLANEYAAMMAKQEGWNTYGTLDYVKRVLAYDPDYFKNGAPGCNGAGGGDITNIPTYKQYDSQWAAVNLGSSNYKIGRSGCLVTCIAMSETCRTGQKVTPAAVAEDCDGSGNYCWSPAYFKLNASDSNLINVYNQLKSGKPVICGSGSTHWVLIVGCTTKNSVSLNPKDFTIHDPGFNNSTLADYLKQFPGGHEYHSYNR